MLNLHSGSPVYSEEHGGEGEITGISAREGYVYEIQWPGGVRYHPSYEAHNFAMAWSLRDPVEKE